MAKPEPSVIAQDSRTITYTEARVLWENGEFSDWVEQHGGLPIIIDNDDVTRWADIEDALSDDSWDN